MVDAHANFAVSTVATAPSPATTGTSLVVSAGHGTRFPTAPFNAVVWPTAAVPDPTNAEIVRVTNIAVDTLTIARAQESSTARSVIVGDQIAAPVTKKTLTDIETAFARVRKTADETVNNSTVLQNDDVLKFALAANEVWTFEAFILYASSAVADLKMAFTVPAGATLHFTRSGITSTDVVDGGHVVVTGSGTTVGTGGQGAGTAGVVHLVGIVINGGTAGDLQFQWAQNTAEVSDTKVLAQSWLKGERVPV